MHRRMNLVTCTIEETCIDKDNALAGRVNAGTKIHGRTTFLVHDADLDGIFLEA